MRLIVTLSVVATLAGAVLFLLHNPGAGETAFPGANGKIAFTSDRDGNDEIL